MYWKASTEIKDSLARDVGENEVAVRGRKEFKKIK